MQYLFFDIEGANCYNFISKMCTFGYVITNEKFKVKSKIDVVINPDSPFDKHIVLENMNAYPLSYYSSRPPFNYFYKSLKKILTEESQLIVGWSIENDVKYIYDACKRYNLGQIKYKYIDMQKVYMKVFDLKNQPSLESVCEENNIIVKVAHKSDDDALLTMLISKFLCKKLNISLEQMFEQFVECVSDVDEFSAHQLTDEEILVKINRRKINNMIKTCKPKKKKSDRKIKEDDIFAFVINVIDNHHEDVKKLIHYIIDCGAKCSNNVCKATKIICLKEQKKNYKSEIFENVKIVDFEKIINSIKQTI